MRNNKDPIKIEWPAGMSETEKDNLREVLYAFDGAAADLEADHKVIFPTEGDRLRLFHTSQKKWLKQWPKPGPCMHEGCSRQSIPRSHTIPMSASLKLIAEDGHVVTPRFGENGVEVVPIGIREASTFPGFCERHEAQFADFESKKEISTAEHFQLQAFRTLCREIYTKQHYKKKFEVSLDEYRKLRDAFVTKRIKQVQSPKPVDVNGLRFENDAVDSRIVKEIEDLGQSLKELDRLYCDLIDDIQGGTSKFSTILASFDMRLPICLSGLGVLNYMEQGTRKRALCVIAIIPEDLKTKIIMGATKEHEEAIQFYFEDQSSPAFLERMESWICHGSDHWFMTPSAWNAIPESRQAAICERILDAGPSIADPVECSVLDGPRMHVVTYIEEQLRAGTIPTANIEAAKQILADEKAKLNDVASVTDGS